MQFCDQFLLCLILMLREEVLLSHSKKNLLTYISVFPREILVNEIISTLIYTLPVTSLPAFTTSHPASSERLLSFPCLPPPPQFTWEPKSDHNVIMTGSHNLVQVEFCQGKKRLSFLNVRPIKNTRPHNLKDLLKYPEIPFRISAGMSMYIFTLS